MFKSRPTPELRLDDCDPCHARASRRPLEAFAGVITRFTGSSWAFAAAVGIIVLWAVSGPVFGFSQTWQLLVNTGTTIATFLMVFLIQRSQNKDSRALHLKLNELLAALEGASNRLLNVEDLSEEQLQTLHRHYAELSRLAQQRQEITKSHSIEEAGRRDRHKHREPASGKSTLQGNSAPAPPAAEIVEGHLE
jgi:low affinity Fe/Cu permease